MRRILMGMGLVLLALFGVGAAFLLEAHWEIRRLAPVLPDDAALAAVAATAGGPVRVRYVVTASQGMPGGGRGAHSVFLVEWPDGRLFAIDAGMDREQAIAFGKPIEALLDAQSIEPQGSLGEQLGAEAKRIRGVAFTHLHVDHTGGLATICGAAKGPVPVFQTPWQADFQNYTTSPGRDDVERATCARTQRLEGAGPLFPIPGFPGLFAMQAGGHTPGSTIFFAHVGGRTWVFSGDVTNAREALLENRPKERIYSLFIVPEAPEHLETLRVWLAGLDARPGFTVVVSHDGDALAASGLSPFAQPPLRDSR